MDKVVDEIDIREKNTSGLEVQLLADAVAINLTGVNQVKWHMIDSLGKVYRYSTLDNSPAISISSEASGKVIYYPPSENIFQYTRSPYKLYLIVYEDATKHYSVPEDGYLKINVTKEY